MSGKGWIIIIIIVLGILGVGFLYFYSPSLQKQNTNQSTPSVPSFQPSVFNETPRPYTGIYNGFLNGSLSGFLFEGIVGNQYQGLFNGSFNGYGYINNKPVFFSTKISNGRMVGVISGQYKINEFRGNIVANVQNVEMNGTYTPLSYKEKTPVTFGSLFKKIWWIFLLACIVVVLIWFIVRMSGGEEFETHSVVEIDLSIRPILEDEPYDLELKQFLRSRPVPNSNKPKYHQILYVCNFPNRQYVLVDAKYERVLRLHRDISGPDIKKMMDETIYTEGHPPEMGYGGYGRGGYRPRYNYRKSTKRQPSEGEFTGEEI